MNTFYQHVSGHGQQLSCRVDNCSIIANAFQRFFMVQGYVTADIVDQSEFAQLFKLCAVVLVFKHLAKVGFCRRKIPLLAIIKTETVSQHGESSYLCATILNDMLTVTERAKNKAVELMKQENKPADAFIRVGVEGGGCSGL